MSRHALRRTRPAPYVHRPRPVAVPAPELYTCTVCGRADLTSEESSRLYNDLCVEHGQQREVREHAEEQTGHRASCDCTQCFEADAASRVRL